MRVAMIGTGYVGLVSGAFLNETPIVFTQRHTSELIKYAANAFIAMKITFINEMADIAEVVGADVQHIARGIGLDKRIGAKFLHAGPGYPGSCFPKDTLALVRTAQHDGAPTQLIEATVRVNNGRKKKMADRIIAPPWTAKSQARPSVCWV